ncbi:MAG: CPBP family intramembrane glutamic endopeptidase [Spirochaeta sp.]
MQRFIRELSSIVLLFVIIMLVTPSGLGRNWNAVLLHAAALFCIAVLIARFTGFAALVMPGIRRTLQHICLGAGYGVLVWIVIQAVIQAAVYLLGPQWMSDIPIYSTKDLRLAVVVPVQMMVGLREELVFRGYFQTRFTQLSGSRPNGIITAGAFFAAAHIPLGTAVVLLSFFGGLLFGWMRDTHRSVIPAGIAHGVYNCLSLLIPLV